MTRARLPDRRRSEIVEFSFFDGREAQRYEIGVSYYADGRIAEVFSNLLYGTGTSIEVLCRDATLILSMALQHGTPMETIWNAMTRDDKDEPATLIGAIVKACVGGAVNSSGSS